MRFARFASTALAALAASSVQAFTPAVPKLLAAAARTSRLSFHTTTSALAANVRRLTEPSSQLLDAVDIFIFDCDCVIWRVRKQLAFGILAMCDNVPILHFARETQSFYARRAEFLRGLLISTIPCRETRSLMGSPKHWPACVQLGSACFL